jgi:hypothetical protein
MLLTDFTYTICVSVLVILSICLLLLMYLLAQKIRPEWILDPLMSWLDKIFYSILDLLLGKGEEVRR